MQRQEVSRYDNRGKIFGIFFISSRDALSASRSGALASGARQQPCCHCGCTGGTASSVSDTHCTAQGHHNGNRRTTTTTQPTTSSGAVARAVAHATDISRTCGSIGTIHLRTPHPTPVPATLPAGGRSPRTCGAARLTGDLRTGGRTTSSPLHGCLPPPSKGGSRGPGRGRAPTQHTILRLTPQLSNSWNVLRLQLQRP